MADNLAITQGSGTSVATDEIGGVHYQRVKLALGADGTANDASAGAGAVGTGTQRVTLGSDDPAVTLLTTQNGYLDGLETAIASTNTKLDTLAGHVDTLETLIAATNTKLDTLNTSSAAIETAVESTTPIVNDAGVKYIDVTLSTDTAAYASGDLIADAQVVAACVRQDDATGVLHSIMVIDEDDQGAAFSIYLASASSTFGTENAAPSISDTNARTILGVVDVATSDYKDLGGVKVAFKGNIGMAIKPATGTDDVYVAVVNSTGTPTYTASGLKLRFGFLI